MVCDGQVNYAQTLGDPTYRVQFQFGNSVWSYMYDTLGRLVRVIDPLGRVRLYPHRVVGLDPFPGIGGYIGVVEFGHRVPGSFVRLSFCFDQAYASLVGNSDHLMAGSI
jgi:hypothetical protein